MRQVIVEMMQQVGGSQYETSHMRLVTKESRQYIKDSRQEAGHKGKETEN